MSVTESDIQFYRENGYVHIPNFLSPSDVLLLKNTVSDITRNAPLPERILPHVKYMGTKYHLDSVDSMQLFFENQHVKDGTLLAPLQQSIHKIGHGVHVESPAGRSVTFSLDMKKAVQSLTGFPSAAVVQSMFLLKQARVGEASGVHIDETYLMTQPPSRVAGVWIALDDALESNGCLEFLPGSHKTHAVNKTWCRKRSSHESGSEWESLMKFDSNEAQESPVDENSFIKVPVRSGGLVLIHGRVLHKSNPNTSQDTRFAYTFHVYDTESQWSPFNWIQEKENYKFPLLF